MADRAQRYCRFPGCRNLTRDPSGYCDTHKTGLRREKGQTIRHDRFYDSTLWRHAAQWHLRRFPMCSQCRLKPASMVHHIVSRDEGGDPFAAENLMALCLSCHNTIHKAKPAKRFPVSVVPVEVKDDDREPV